MCPSTRPTVPTGQSSRTGSEGASRGEGERGYGRACPLRAPEPVLLSLQLPLPLMELMENEVLEILTKALQSEPPNPQAVSTKGPAWLIPSLASTDVSGGS